MKHIVISIFVLSIFLPLSASSSTNDLALELLLYVKTDITINDNVKKRSDDVLSGFEADIRNQLDPNFELPESLRNEIRDYYIRKMSWDNLQEEIINLYTDSYSERELRIMYKFYRREGVSPDDTDLVQQIGIKMGAIQERMRALISVSGKDCFSYADKRIRAYLSGSSTGQSI